MAATFVQRLATAALLGLIALPCPLHAQSASDAPSPGAAGLDAGERQRAAAERQEQTQRAAAEARRRAAEARRKADVAQRNAEQLRRDEADMLARARAEAEERAAERQVREAEVERTEAERAAVAARNENQALQHDLSPAEREAAEERLIEAAKAADAARRAMEEAREVEASRLADKLRQAQERRAAAGAERRELPPSQPISMPPAIAPAVPEAPARLGSAPPAMPPDPSPTREAAASIVPPLAAGPEQQVTVLILMQPGNRGIRRFNASADPVLCLGDACYISRGADRDAKRMSRRQALGALNTLGGRAGACRDQLGCVFRNVDLGGARAALQPIDLRLVRHDRRETREIGADPTCKVISGRLSCAGIEAADYRLWLVPESIAAKAGPAVLDAAVREGLRDGRRAELQRR